MKNFNNKIVWITGASDGIGKEMAIQMAAQGAKIVLTARSVGKLNALKVQLKGEGHLVYPMDLLKVDAIPKAAKEVLQKMGRIDILVNNAGISQRSLAKNTALAVDRKIMEIDYFAVVALTKAVLPQMLERKSGHIVAISSVAGKIGAPMRSAYCGAKHAVVGFMDVLRAETYAEGLKVLVVTPGSVKTNISINALEGDGKKHNVTDPLIENGIAVEVCVEKILQGIKKDTKELLIADTRTSMAVYLRRFFPNRLFKLMTTMQAT